MTDRGWFCPGGGFHIDPSVGVPLAVVTHAHSDHARPGSKAYICASSGTGLLRRRVGSSATIQGMNFGESFELNGYRISLHPAGHVLGSSQVRVEYRGEVWVVSGDYKTTSDPTSEPFEPQRCHTFITESTFGLPLYRWPNPDSVFESIHSWWRGNREAGRVSVLFAYSLGKAQRLLAGLNGSHGPILVHRTILEFLGDYERAGVRLPQVMEATADSLRTCRCAPLVLTPPGALHQELQAFPEVEFASASGWMLTRKGRGQRGAFTGFVLSDHADWDGLNAAVTATGAEQVLVTHGYSTAFARWLRGSGLNARAVGEHDPEVSGPVAEDEED